MIDLRKQNLPNAIKVDGKFFSIHTDFRVWLEFGEKIKDKNCTLKDITFVFKNDIPNVNFVQELMNFFINENATPKKQENDGEVILDYILDGEYIYGSFMSEYRIDLIDIEELHWHKFKALFLCLSDTTKIKDIMSIRGYNKSNKKIEEQYRERKNAWELPNLEQEEENQRLLKEFNNL